MSNGIKLTPAGVWRNGYFFALILLVFLGVCLIIIATYVFPDGSIGRIILTGVGISMAPAAIVAALFRMFLFKEVQYQLTQPVIDEVNEKLAPKIMRQIDELAAEYKAELELLSKIKDAGITHVYRQRELALKIFMSSIEEEKDEIMIIGSSLKGLLLKDKFKDVASKIRTKVQEGRVHVKFLLTHPIIADLRAGQENRQFTEIGKEIITSLHTLKEWGVPPTNVRLYKGTPTCFAIKTSTKMLLNPYPYGGVSFDSPCIIVETSPASYSYFYGEFDKSHFSVWDTNFSEQIEDFDSTIDYLQLNLDKYAGIVGNMLK